jgi:ComF family protein
VAPKLYFPTTRDLPSSLGQKILDGLLNLVYPEACLLCSEPMSRHQDRGVCSRCWDKIVALKINPPRCASCGLPFQNFQEDSGHLCGDCIQQMPSYSGARSFGYYTAELGVLIQELKFRGKRNLVGLLVPLMAGTFYDAWDRDQFDSIAPIPLHAKRRRERGFNQSELLAKELGRSIGIPYKRALVRVRATQPQVGLSDTQRRDNVRNAFRCAGPQEVMDKRILLIDDVMTTGATVASAAQALMDAGAWRVSVLTVARAPKS